MPPRRSGLDSVAKNAEEFLQRWVEVNVPIYVEPTLRVSRAQAMARKCPEDAENAGMPEEDLTLAAYGNLVTYFQNKMLRVRKWSGDQAQLIFLPIRVSDYRLFASR